MILKIYLSFTMLTFTEYVKIHDKTLFSCLFKQLVLCKNTIRLDLNYPNTSIWSTHLRSYNLLP